SILSYADVSNLDTKTKMGSLLKIALKINLTEIMYVKEIIGTYDRFGIKSIKIQKTHARNHIRKQYTFRKMFAIPLINGIHQMVIKSKVFIKGKSLLFKILSDTNNIISEINIVTNKILCQVYKF